MLRERHYLRSGTVFVPSEDLDLDFSGSAGSILFCLQLADSIGFELGLCCIAICTLAQAPGIGSLVRVLCKGLHPCTSFALVASDTLWSAAVAAGNAARHIVCAAADSSDACRPWSSARPEDPCPGQYVHCWRRSLAERLLHCLRAVAQHGRTACKLYLCRPPLCEIWRMAAAERHCLKDELCCQQTGTSDQFERAGST